MSLNSTQQATGTAPGPAARQRVPGSATDDCSGPNTTDEQWADTLAQVSAIADLTKAWAGNLHAVAKLELMRSVKALRQLLFLQLLMLPLALCFLLSLCLAIAGTVYLETNSIYGAIGVFLGAQIAIILATVFAQKSLRQLVGFKHTKQQVQEAKHDLLAALK